MIWRVNREVAVMLGGTCALLLQLAHPLVTAGVRDHSDFRADPLGRLSRTFRLTLNLVFGTRQEALQSARAINRRHRTVQGTNYSATDPDLLLWVQATLVYSALTAYTAFVNPLSDAERDGYYQDTKRLGLLLGIPPHVYPDDIRAFDDYFGAMIASGPIEITPDARRLAAAVLRPPIRLVPALAFEPLKVITAGLLPEPVRREFGLAWGRPQRTAFRVCRRAINTLIPLTPPLIRTLSPARAAVRRIRAA